MHKKQNDYIFQIQTQNIVGLHFFIDKGVHLKAIIKQYLFILSIKTGFEDCLVQLKAIPSLKNVKIFVFTISYLENKSISCIYACGHYFTSNPLNISYKKNKRKPSAN